MTSSRLKWFDTAEDAQGKAAENLSVSWAPEQGAKP
jgi:hypothetical protein